MSFEYQKRGIKFLMQNNRAYLADEMGLGKTRQAISAAKNLGLLKHGPIIVVCPATAKYNWQAEFKKWANEDAEVLEKKMHPSSNLYNGVYICSYDFAKYHLVKLHDLWPTLVIFDEAHYLKEPKTIAVNRLLINSKSFVLNSEYFWCLSGTPMPNHVGELWPILSAFGLDVSSYDAFTQRYCRFGNIKIQSKRGVFFKRKIIGTQLKLKDEIRRILKPVMLRREKEKVLKDLPKIQINAYYIEGYYNKMIVPGEFMERVEKAREELTEVFDGELDDDILLKQLMAMSKSISTLSLFHGLGKVRNSFRLIKNEILDRQYRKSVIFGTHTAPLQMMHEEFNRAKISSYLITGATPSKERFNIQNKFQKSNKPCVFIGNIQAAGTNLNLTAANIVNFLELDWVPGNNSQALARCHRIGQTKNVFARVLAIKDSLDTKMIKVIMRKTKEIKGVLG